MARVVQSICDSPAFVRQGLSVFKNIIPSFPRKREPRMSLRHEALDSGFRRSDGRLIYDAITLPFV